MLKIELFAAFIGYVLCTICCFAVGENHFRENDLKHI